MKALQPIAITLCILLWGVVIACGQPTKTNTATDTLQKPVLPPSETPVVMRTETSKADSSHIFVHHEQLPAFPGGDAALFKFIKENARYPDSLIGSGRGFRVICTFIILVTGEIRDPEVVRGVDCYFDREALRIINLMPNWIPGEQHGKKTQVKYTLPIRFEDPNPPISP